jgi:hypothetical protein
MRPEVAKVVLVNAIVRCRLGRDDECLEWLERAVRLGTSRAEIEGAPELSRLADHPRFRALLDLAS